MADDGCKETSGDSRPGGPRPDPADPSSITWLMTDAKKRAGILDQDARVPVRLIFNQSYYIIYFCYRIEF
jgi:hypothetical protein